ncbi:hypothetical protein CCP1ISM_40011 [Azospirillaceae bacterium]
MRKVFGRNPRFPRFPPFIKVEIVEGKLPKRFDALVARVRAVDDANKVDDTAKKLRHDETLGSSEVVTPVSLKTVLQSVVSVCNNFGFDFLRLQLSGNDVRFWAADGTGKPGQPPSVFMEAKAIVKETDVVEIAISELDELLSLLKDDTLPLGFEFGDRTVHKKSDPEDDESETISVTESVVKHLVFGKCRHRVMMPSAAPIAKLKKEPNWTTVCKVDKSSLDHFIKHATRLKRSAKRFNGHFEGDRLVFRIGEADASNVEVPIGVCLRSDAIGNHYWKVDAFLHLLKSAGSSKSMTIMISEEIGVIRADFGIECGGDAEILYQVIMTKA